VPGGVAASLPVANSRAGASQTGRLRTTPEAVAPSDKAIAGECTYRVAFDRVVRRRRIVQDALVRDSAAHPEPPPGLLSGDSARRFGHYPVEEGVKSTHGDHDPSAQAHAWHLPPTYEFVGVASGNAEYLAGLPDREGQPSNWRSLNVD
jgi:hypothetical protein